MPLHWADLVQNPQLLGSLYSTVPPLKSARLRSFHLDWRGPTLTLRIDLPSYPENPPPAWSELGHNALQVHLQFLAIDDLTVHGWIANTRVDMALSALPDRRLLTRISGRGLKFSFICSDSLTVGHISSFRPTASGSDHVMHSFLQHLDARMFSSVPSTHESTFYERI
ncbi:Imm50 family immunity protein [Streptomyces sp. ME02-6991-2A]|uniref:Imm50 family immunity protein n=1 Tax=Streptomyces sp. ME02-6991-2A TaxID=3028677 RepID=UPI0029A0771E|nr:Imm50 family immunity protein [Streptomyces sp. ME02-6991-2A]MDX3374285.1 Imm50 family immunity protein [Streptomyces sp. ME02-6991-2A]